MHDRKDLFMRIAVALATYNGARFIEEQLDSILQQTIKPDEVLISDDGSSDNTVEIVKEYIKIHNLEKKWILHQNEINKGYAKNFMDAAMMARGDIIFFCDQDDIWIEDRIEIMSHVMQDRTDISLLCTNLVPFYYEDNTKKWDKKILEEMKTDRSIEYHELTVMDIHLRRAGGCSMCIRKSFLESIMPFWIEGWAHDDFVWNMAVVACSCAVFHYTSLKRRMHANNTTVIRDRTREWRINQLKQYIVQFNSLKRYAIQCGLDNSKSSIIDKNLKSLYLRLKVIKNHRVLLWIPLALKYKDCYPRKIGLYLDLYLSLFNSYRGV